MKYIDRVVAWVTYSSADPKKTSLTIKMALVAVIPMITKIIPILCAMGVVCLQVNDTDLKMLFDIVGDIVYALLWLVALVGSLYGLQRKIVRTIKGTNKVFPYYFGK